MRIDLSDQLIHLTRGNSLADGEGIFRKILTEKRLLGSDKGIRGGHRVICFSEAPIDVLAKLFASSGHGFRYRPFGIMIPKHWLFSKGGRPVIYQPEAEYGLLPDPLQYRHVRFDEPGASTDFTFEREWRICAEELPLDPLTCTLIVPDREWDYRLRQEHDERDMNRARAMRMNPFTRMTDYRWHVLALGDLGAKLQLDD
jgi:hypothetical protein